MSVRGEEINKHSVISWRAHVNRVAGGGETYHTFVDHVDAIYEQGQRWCVDQPRAFTKQCTEPVTAAMWASQDPTEFFECIPGLMASEEMTEHLITFKCPVDATAELKCLIGGNMFIVGKGDIDSVCDYKKTTPVLIEWDQKEHSLTIEAMFYDPDRYGDARPTECQVRAHGTVKWGAAILGLIDELARATSAQSVNVEDVHTFYPDWYHGASLRSAIILTALRDIGYYEKYGYIPTEIDKSIDMLAYMNDTTLGAFYSKRPASIPAALKPDTSIAHATRELARASADQHRRGAEVSQDFNFLCFDVDRAAMKFIARYKTKQYRYSNGKTKVSEMRVARDEAGKPVGYTVGMAKYVPVISIIGWKRRETAINPKRRKMGHMDTSIARLHI